MNQQTPNICKNMHTIKLYNFTTAVMKWICAYFSMFFCVRKNTCTLMFKLTSSV